MTTPVDIGTSRLRLRDFVPADRAAFVAYQCDPRYSRLYGYDDARGQAEALFDRFLDWQRDTPRPNIQLGIFDRATGRLCGSAGLRIRAADRSEAMFGIELAPADWGRYAVALTASACLIDYGFETLGLRTIAGETASGNHRVARLAQWFGATETERRPGADWMTERGWEEVVWTLTADGWKTSSASARLNAATA